MKKIVLAVMVIITAALVAMFFLKGNPAVKTAPNIHQKAVATFVATSEPQAE